jgi:hypothetical protein
MLQIIKKKRNNILQIVQTSKNSIIKTKANNKIVLKEEVL